MPALANLYQLYTFERAHLYMHIYIYIIYRSAIEVLFHFFKSKNDLAALKLMKLQKLCIDYPGGHAFDRGWTGEASVQQALAPSPTAVLCGLGLGDCIALPDNHARYAGPKFESKVISFICRHILIPVWPVYSRPASAP